MARKHLDGNDTNNESNSKSTTIGEDCIPVAIIEEYVLTV